MDKRKSSGKSGKERVIDLNSYRQNKNEEKRREYERILFNRVLGVYSFAEKEGLNLNHVEVVDVSYSGIRFREERPEMPFKAEQKIALRFYFTPNTYLRVVLEVKRVLNFEENGRSGVEYGCEIDKETKSYEVINQLVNFMYKYADTACQDNHPPLVWF